LDRSPSVRGGAPPGKEEGAASTAKAFGPDSKDVDRHNLPEAFASSESFWDNARGDIDGAIAELYRAYGAGLISDDECGAIDAELRARQRRAFGQPVRLRQLGTLKSKLALGWPRRRPRRSPNREASRERARMLGGAGRMPSEVRAKYTECERAVLYIVASEVKRHGVCDLSIGEISARAGVCHRTTQNAIAEGVRQQHLTREERERKGQRNDTNVVKIVAEEWVSWIARGPMIGCKVFSATENIDSKTRGTSQFSESRVTPRDPGPRVVRILRVSK
jgi:hypothetical protein